MFSFTFGNIDEDTLLKIIQEYYTDSDKKFLCARAIGSVLYGKYCDDINHEEVHLLPYERRVVINFLDNNKESILKLVNTKSVNDLAILLHDYVKKDSNL